MIWDGSQVDFTNKMDLILLYRAILSLVLVLLFFPALLWAERNVSTELQEKIQEKKQKIKDEEQDLHRLTRKEREIYSDLARVEERIRKLDMRLEEQEDELAQNEQREQQLQKGQEQLEQKIEAAKNDLLKLLQFYWPVYVHSQSFDPGRFSSLQEARRDMVWLGEIYGLVLGQAEQLAQEQERLKQILAKQKSLRKQVARQVEEVRSTQDELLQEKLAFLHRVQEVRARRLAKEEQLQEIHNTISQLQQRVNLLKTRDIQELKGHLPWPAQGKKILDYNNNADPPHHGIGLSLTDGQVVQAVCWGKVVFSETLRGYGQVVILFHGNDYYTLYAFLSRSMVRVGQNVEKGEPVGQAGYYPRIQGTGLYFELRMGQKPINPESWLVRPG